MNSSLPLPRLPAALRSVPVWHMPVQRLLAHEHAASNANCFSPQFAQLQHCCVLINCYAREVAMQEHTLAVRAIEHIPEAPPDLLTHSGQVLEIALPRVASRLCVGVKHVSVTGNFDYTSAFYLKNDSAAWRQATWRELADLIILDLSTRENSPFNHDLLQQIEESITTMQHLLDRRRPVQQESPSLTPFVRYVESEQSLLTGHPFHPAPKSRSGWSAHEDRQYAPEHRSELRLRYFQLPKAWIIADSLDGGADALGAVLAALAELTVHGLIADDGFAIIPLHPWQADYLSRQAIVIEAMCKGQIRDLGEHGATFFPTASIRTMLATGGSSFLKLSLNMRVTNCIRNNARHELESALSASRIFRLMKEEVKVRFPHFHVLEERCYLTLAIPGAGTVTTSGDDTLKEIEDGFGLVIREGLAGLMQQGQSPLICAALFGNGQYGRRQVADLIERYSHQHGMPLSQGVPCWFAAYAQALIYPVFYLLFEKGIAFEPHMQNTLLALAADGSPAHIILRDLELTRLTPQAHALCQNLALNAHTRQVLCCDEQAGWTRIGYCLLVNNICEVIATLANGNHSLYLDLWSVLRTTLQSYLAQFPNPQATRRIQGLLSGEPLPVKGNLLTRFLKQADRQAAYLPLYHPLGVVNGAATFF